MFIFKNIKGRLYGKMIYQLIAQSDKGYIMSKIQIQLNNKKAIIYTKHYKYVYYTTYKFIHIYY